LDQRKEMSLPAKTTTSRAPKLPHVSCLPCHDTIGINLNEFQPL
jgi:hypothetical protein